MSIDAAVVCMAASAVAWFHVGLARDPGHQLQVPQVGFLFLYVALTVLACATQTLYRTAKDQSTIEETFRVVKAVGLATSLFVVFIFTSGNAQISLAMVIEAGTLNAIALAGWRYAKRHYVLTRATHGEGLSRVLIIGAGNAGRALAEWFGANWQLGYEVCGFLDPHMNGDPRVLGTTSDFKRVALEQFVDEVFVTLPVERQVVEQIFFESRRLHLDMNVVPDLYDGLGWHAPLHSVGGFPVLQLHGQPIPAIGLAVKRAMDIVIATLALFLGAPLLALAALWIRVDSPGPLLYCAQRVGRKGRRFRCYKLRTMVPEADATKKNLRSANERRGPFFKMEHDPRVTRCGAWLRRFSIDELPQLVNVILGDMSLVGPRPHPVDDVERYQIEDLRRLDVKPGMSGLWQVTARRDPSFARNMSLDLEYIENWSLGLDVKILLNTIPEILRGEGN